MSTIQAIKGMKDLLPDESPIWQYIEATAREVLHGYGYREIRFPLLEQTALFQRGIGEATDIVEKEMYTFDDRNGDRLTLRPEGTASCVRACEQHGLLFDRGNLTQKLWYSGPMFRHENPQKGRLRQFHQFGVEAFGFSGPDVDAELLLMTARLWRRLGVDDVIRLQINSLGTPESRAEHKRALVAYLQAHYDDLDADSQRRIATNPLRVFDSKVVQTQEVLQGAPLLTDFLDDAATQHFAELRAILDAAGIAYELNPRLVRGLDYYSLTVFEWVTDKLGAQGTVCGGGRYDGLVEQLGGRPTPAIGFGMGVERLVLLLTELQRLPADISQVLDVYVVAAPEYARQAMQLGEALRDALPGRRIQTHCGGGNFRNQMKKADKSGARFALILGEHEFNNGEVTVKYLREAGEQCTVKRTNLVQFIQNLCQE